MRLNVSVPKGETIASRTGSEYFADVKSQMQEAATEKNAESALFGKFGAMKWRNENCA